MNAFEHLDALKARLFRERSRLSKAATENEKTFRLREIASCEKEIAAEYKFLGIKPVSLDDILDDELISELSRESTA